ncbi:MAG: hypothetical protein IJQ15_08240 [Synergistaceae bacterium]|nr:hypothetical protein [Synergistaceae bacterium]MBQ6114712.1 hypothetical protein [Synergistaceae bacterium]MBQ6982397.1 hypothetical protein [Synergistaceae bacterium]
MKKIAVMVLVSIVFVSLSHSVSFAVIDDGRATSRALEHAAKASERAAQGDKDGAVAESAMALSDYMSCTIVMSTAAGAAAGAATGAAVGSVVPLFGTVIGAGIGAMLWCLWSN